MSEPEITYNLEEKIKKALVHPKIYYTFYAHWIRWRGERELKLLPQLIDRNRNSVDAGANRGGYTYWMQKYSRHVFAYEPNPKMFEALKGGAAGNVTPLPYALSNKAARIKLRIPKTKRGYSNQGASLNYAKVGSSYGEIEIETRRLDDEKIKNVGFIKIDVEGHEFEVLEGAQKTIERDRPKLLIEMEERYNGIPIEESISRIKKLGYRGLIYQSGVLRDVERFDAATNHRSPLTSGDYIFNFLFLPVDMKSGDALLCATKTV